MIRAVFFLYEYLFAGLGVRTTVNFKLSGFSCRPTAGFLQETRHGKVGERVQYVH